MTPTLPPDPAPNPPAPNPPPTSHRSTGRSRISGSFFLATFVLCGLVVLGVVLGMFVFDSDPDSSSSSATHPHHSHPHRFQPAGPPNLLRIRAVPSAAPTTLSAPASPSSPTHPGPQVLNLFLVPADTATATLPPDPTTGQLDPAGLAAYNCVPVSQQAIRTLCWGTALLPYGQVTFQGSQLENAALDSPPRDSTTFIITGGTDVYARATGTLGMRVLPNSGQQDWTFRFTSISAPTPKKTPSSPTSPTTDGSSP